MRGRILGREEATRVRADETNLGDGVLNHLLVGHIGLVANEQLVDALGGVAVNLLQPLLDVVERVHVRHVVDNADAVGAAIVGRGDGAETLLAGRVPLHFWISPVMLDDVVVPFLK